MNRETISAVAIIALAYFVVASTSVIHWSQWLALGAMIMIALWTVRDDWFYKRVESDEDCGKCAFNSLDCERFHCVDEDGTEHIYKRQWWPFILVAVVSILAAVVL